MCCVPMGGSARRLPPGRRLFELNARPRRHLDRCTHHSTVVAQQHVVSILGGHVVGDAVHPDIIDALRG